MLSAGLGEEKTAARLSEVAGELSRCNSERREEMRGRACLGINRLQQSDVTLTT